MRHIRISKGIEIPFAGKPEQAIRKGHEVSRVALLGADHPGLRPLLAVEVGARVRAGQRLFADRRTPLVAHVAPVAGTVREIALGARRMLDRIVIERDGEAAETFILSPSQDREALTGLLCETGLWPALRARPFGRMPQPGTEAAAIFVTALDTRPLSADPDVVLRGREDEFHAGLDALRRLTDGPLYLCQKPGVDRPAPSGVTPAAFSGPHPAGLPGTHIHYLSPVSANRSVWQIGYDDVVSIGHLLLAGRIRTERVVAFAGPAALSPGLLRTMPGACLAELARGELSDPKARLLSGSPLGGSHQPFLGRFDLQVGAMPARGAKAGPPRTRLERILALLAARSPVLIPNAAHERVAPARILPVPFLRALGTGDTEAAARLGALELCEEDMALLSHLDGVDYGPLLRRTLDDLEAAQ